MDAGVGKRDRHHRSKQCKKQKQQRREENEGILQRSYEEGRGVKRTYKSSSSSSPTLLSLLSDACLRFPCSCSLWISCESTVGEEGSRQEGGIQKKSCSKARKFSTATTLGGKGRDRLPLPPTAVMEGGACPAALWQEAAGFVYQFLCCHRLRLLQPARLWTFSSRRIESRSR